MAMAAASSLLVVIWHQVVGAPVDTLQLTLAAATVLYAVVAFVVLGLQNRVSSWSTRVLLRWVGVMVVLTYAAGVAGGTEFLPALFTAVAVWPLAELRHAVLQPKHTPGRPPKTLVLSVQRRHTLDVVPVRGSLEDLTALDAVGGGFTAVPSDEERTDLDTRSLFLAYSPDPEPVVVGPDEAICQESHLPSMVAVVVGARRMEDGSRVLLNHQQALEILQQMPGR